MAHWICILLSLIALSHLSDAYKILVVFPMPAKSHSILGDGIVRNLLNAGHEITYITPYPKKDQPNLTYVDVSATIDIFPVEMINIEKLMNKETDMSDNIELFFFFDFISTYTIENPNVQSLLADQNRNYDLVIAEWLFSELYSGLSAVFGAPYIWVSSVEPHWIIMSLIDEPLNPAYNDCLMDHVPPFTFYQRVDELWYMIKMAVVRETALRYLQTKTYNQKIAPHCATRGRIAPSFQELRYNASLVLGNSHVSIGHATRLPQNYISIAGYHIDEKVKPLPEDLKNIMDSSKHGVIYFSMGSNLKSKELPDELKQSLLEMFGSLKQTVLWKFEEKLSNTPKNVHILNWAPQPAILAHPNCVLFITHGGLLSTIEAISAGKPVIGIPVFGDQFANINRAVIKGYAKKVDLSYTMSKDLKSAIEEILTDPRYNQKVKELSFIYHDRPVKPSAELVHWVEHVVKTGGAPHLYSTALIVPWYQKIYLDLVVIIGIVFIILKKLLAFTLSFRRKEISSSKKRN